MARSAAISFGDLDEVANCLDHSIYGSILGSPSHGLGEDDGRNAHVGTDFPCCG